jgi:hypothetical protein
MPVTGPLLVVVAMIVSVADATFGGDQSSSFAEGENTSQPFQHKL